MVTVYHPRPFLSFIIFSVEFAIPLTLCNSYVRVVDNKEPISTDQSSFS